MFSELDGYLCDTKRFHNKSCTLYKVWGLQPTCIFLLSPVWICLTKHFKKNSCANLFKATTIKLICRCISITSTVWARRGDKPKKKKKICTQKYPQCDTVGACPQVWVNVKSNAFCVFSFPKAPLLLLQMWFILNILRPISDKRNNICSQNHR